MCGMLSSISRLTAIVRRSIRLDGFLMCDEAGVFGVERQRDEGLEAAGFVLQFAEADQVVDAVVRLFDVAVEHRAVRAEAEFVGRAMDFEPAAGVGFVFADLVADFGVEDFRAAAGQAAEAGVDHVFEDLADRLLGEAAEPIDLDGRPGFEVQLGVGFVQEADDVEVPVVLALMVQAADDVHLGAAVLDGLGAAGEDLLVAHQRSPSGRAGRSGTRRTRSGRRRRSSG